MNQGWQEVLVVQVESRVFNRPFGLTKPYVLNAGASGFSEVSYPSTDCMTLQAIVFSSIYFME